MALPILKQVEQRPHSTKVLIIHSEKYSRLSIIRGNGGENWRG
jgi:hypothetical protein